MPARVNNPRAAEQLRREYTVRGDRLNLQVDDIVVPVAIVADISAGSRGVPTVRRAYATFQQAAVALEYTTWRIEVPPSFIVVLNRVHVWAAASTTLVAHVGSSIPAPANLATTQLMDGRLRQSGLWPAARVAFGTQVAALAAPFRFLTAVGAGYDNIVEWPFGRDDGGYDFIEFQLSTINDGGTVSMEWDEIPLLP